MRIQPLVLGVLVGGLVLTGCAGSQTPWKGGETKRAYYGGVTLVLTNASPGDMCGFQMTADGEVGLGDNWLPREGLESGQSIELHVRPGAYQATWSTCRRGAQPYFAGTLIGERAFEVRGETQLYVFVADIVAPTSRAATRDHDYQVVKFPGQAIGLVADATGSNDVEREVPAAAKPARGNFGDVIDRKSRPSVRKRSLAPSFARTDRR
jgi:hypothetical protein